MTRVRKSSIASWLNYVILFKFYKRQSYGFTVSPKKTCWSPHPLPLNVIYFEIRFSQMKWSCSHTGVEWTLNPTELVSLPEEEITVKAQTHREKPVPCLQRQKLEWSTKSKKDQDSGWAPDARGGEGRPSLVRRRHSPANVLIPDVESLELWGKFLI